MMTWSEYQEQVAAFFRSVGLSARTNQPILGARGEHAIDVVVTFRQFGIDVLWIVECKLWKSAVTKEKVVALQQIAQDVGADRAFLLSESGFQAGAIRAVQFSNTSLTSIRDLRENSQEVAASAEWSALSLRLSELDSRLSLWFVDSAERPGPRPGVDFDKVATLSGRLLFLKTNLANAIANRFPICVDPVGCSDLAHNASDFVRLALRIIDEVAEGLAEIEASAKEMQLKIAQKIGRFICCTEALLESGETAIRLAGSEPEAHEQALLRAHEDMKAIGDCLDGIGSILSGRTRSCYQALRPLLIDGIYLHLINAKVTREEWCSTACRVKDALSDLRESLSLPLHRVDDRGGYSNRALNAASTASE